jgi:hypothetical protein
VIVVAVDDEVHGAASIRYAAELAVRLGATLVVAAVAQTYPLAQLWPLPLDLPALAEDRHLALLCALVPLLEPAPVEWHLADAGGDLAEVTLRYDAALVVMPRPRSRRHGRRLHRLAERLRRRHGCAVLLAAV